MKYEITTDSQERFLIDFTNDGANVVGLRMAPDALESELQTGDWLILAFAVWDSRDRPAIEVAYQIAASRKDIRVAVRPFELADEFRTWAPELSVHELTMAISEAIDESGAQVSITSSGDDHPMWLAFRDGKMIAASVGVRSLDEVNRFLTGSLRR